MGLRREREGQVEIVTIDRPQVSNAIDPDTTAEIEAAFDELEHDRQVACVVLTGAGADSFCSGVDLNVHAEVGPEGVLTANGFAGITRREFPKPLIAAVNGAAIGGGFEIALAADLCIAARHASFAFPEVRLGLMPDGSGAIWLPNRIPMPIALEIVLTGTAISAARACELGLVNRVVDASDTVPAAVALAKRIAEGAPKSIFLTKKLTREALNMPADAAWSLNFHYMDELMKTHDYWEGPRAFVEKREPRWSEGEIN